MENHRLKILIVDDEKGLRLGTKRLLEKQGHQVSTAENGTEGINIGTQSEFDIAIIDLKMPDIDGLSVLQEIRKSFPNTVCFIATAYASYDTAIEATKLGAYSYIPKPFSPEELLENIRKASVYRMHLLEKEKWIKEREARLLEVAFEKTRINTIINSISDGILVVNKNGEAVLYNPSALKYLGLNEIRIEEYIVGRLNPVVANLILKYLEQGTFEKSSYSSQVQLESEVDLFIEATSSPVPHPDGSLAGVVVVLKNITELKKLEQLKSQFVSMVSHELKAPLAAVYGYLQILSDRSIHTSPEQQTAFIDRSMTRLDSLLKMVNDLLDISRLEMKTTSRQIKELEVQEIIRNIVELFQIDIHNKELLVETKVCKYIPPVKADAGEINRLFTNLISNAIKYNRQKGRIDICIQTSEHYLTVEIADTGIGMKPEETKRLFQEFYRAKNDRTKNINGTGLGLSIVKRIVDAYSGKIEINSEFNTGTTFKIFLPFNTVNTYSESTG